ncbi:MAG: hypothetical protein WC506_05860 [Candidatus Micrarchaeia archaeon]
MKNQQKKNKEGGAARQPPPATARELAGFKVQLAKSISVATSVGLITGMFLFFGNFLDLFMAVIAAFVVWLFAAGILLYFFALGDM